MTMVDERGRVFGRVNLVDALVVAFFLLLIPIAYGTWLLFHPKKVQITSVTRVTLTKEEQRIANPLRAAFKLKVKGSGFTPMLRAWVGSDPSLGFTFEDPNSADVIVGPLPPGSYDVALYDAGQEVARAPKAFVIAPSQEHPQIKTIGRIVNLDRASADALQRGAAYPSAADARVRVEALGPVASSGYSLLVQPGKDPQRERLEVPRDGAFERAAALVVACDPSDQPESVCTISGSYPVTNTQLGLPGPAGTMTFIVDDVLPTTPPQPIELTMRVETGAEGDLVQIGDRDALLDDRAAVVLSVGPRQAAGQRDVKLRVGVDRAHDGWRYRGRVVKPGVPFVLSTDRYIAGGTVVGVQAPGSAGANR